MKAAEQARLAYLGANQAECVPWDELKPEMWERWCRVVDVCQPAPIRVPFSDAVPENMAREFAEALCSEYHGWGGWDDMAHEKQAELIRAVQAVFPRCQRDAVPVKVRIAEEIDGIEYLYHAEQKYNSAWGKSLADSGVTYQEADANERNDAHLAGIAAVLDDCAAHAVIDAPGIVDELKYGLAAAIAEGRDNG